MAPRAGLQRNAGDGERGPAQLLACKKAAARPLARRAHANATRPQDTRTARAARAERRPGGPADAYKRDARLRCSQHTPNSREHATPRANRSPAAPPPAAVAQDLPHEADARQEDGSEPAHPPVDPHAHGQQDPLELEAAALAPHEARLVSLLKKRVRLVYRMGFASMACQWMTSSIDNICTLGLNFSAPPVKPPLRASAAAEGPRQAVPRDDHAPARRRRDGH